MKKFSPIIIILVLAALAVGVTYWRGQDKATITPQQVIEQESQTIPEVSVTDQTAKWKIYRNEKYGYEIKYPNDWESGELSQVADRIFIQSEVRDTEVSYISIETIDNPDGLSNETWWRRYKDKGSTELIYRGLMSFNDWSARVYKEAEGFETSYYIISKENKIFLISSFITEPLMRNVMSTFKFTK